jgi:hypothetical protein
MKPRILFVMLEFPRWSDASRWGYHANIGMEPGFKANNIDYTILPATHRYGGHIPFWVDHAHKLLHGQRFDQVWFEVVHSAIDDRTLDFIASLAPVRLGFSFESLELLPVEWENNPKASQIREETLKKRLAITTHLLTSDETDAVRLVNQPYQVRPMPPGFVMPKAFITECPPPPQVPFGLFYGTLYGERERWVNLPELSTLLRYVNASPETHTEYPSTFDKLNEYAAALFAADQATSENLNSYIAANRQIRLECFKLWLAGLQLGAAVVNLPQWGRAYASRVVEGMAAGRPVITPQMDNRPLAKAAFEDGKEILLYRTPDELAQHLQRVIHDRDYATGVAKAAQEKLKQTHCMETYFSELLRWIG